MIRIFNSYLVELNFAAAPAAGTKTYFLDIPFLRDKYIYGIETVTASQMAVSPTSKAMITQANSLTGALTLVQKSTEIFFQTPMALLITNFNSGIVKEFSPVQLDLQKSYVQVFSAGIAATESVCFNFIYLLESELETYLSSGRRPLNQQKTLVQVRPKR